MLKAPDVQLLFMKDFWKGWILRKNSDMQLSFVNENCAKRCGLYLLYPVPKYTNTYDFCNDSLYCAWFPFKSMKDDWAPQWPDNIVILFLYYVTLV